MNDLKLKTDEAGLKETGVCVVCWNACRKAVVELARAKAAAFAEWSDALKAQQHTLRLALNEAEALARQTMYPHLLFPLLASEKAQAVVAWNNRQQKLWQQNPATNQ